MRKTSTTIPGSRKSTCTLLLRATTTLVFLLIFITAKAVYIPVTVTGFTADVIANGVGAANTTATATFDGGPWYCLDDSYRFNSSVTTPPVYSLPSSGIINSVATSGLSYQLAASSGNNSLRINTASGSGTLTLASPISAGEVYILAGSGNGASTVTFVVNFTDATSQTFAAVNIPDWYSGTGFAIQAIGRVNSTNSLDGTALNPRLYERKLILSASNYSKQIGSITVTRTNTGIDVLNVMAVTIATPVTGMAEIKSATGSYSLKVYPNPASAVDGFWIDFGGTPFANEKVTLQIYNIMGKKVYETEIAPNSMHKSEIKPETQLIAGVYFVQVKSGNKTGREKFVLK